MSMLQQHAHGAWGEKGQKVFTELCYHRSDTEMFLYQSFALRLLIKPG